MFFSNILIAFLTLKKVAFQIHFLNQGKCSHFFEDKKKFASKIDT